MIRVWTARWMLAVFVEFSLCQIGMGQRSSDASQPPAAAVRTWRDATGKFEVSAQLIGQTADKVKLKKADGNVIEVPTSKLSAADQEYLQGLGTDESAENPFAGGRPASDAAVSKTLAPVPKSEAPSSVVRGELKEGLLPLQLFRGEPPHGLSDPNGETAQLRPGGFTVTATDAYDQLSLPVVLDDTAGKVAMSVGRHVINKPQEARGRIFVGTLPQGPVDLVFEVQEGIILFDHHSSSDRSVLVSGFDGLGRGGELVILEGLGSGKPREIYRRVLPGIDTPGFKPKVEWAYLLNSEHVAVVVNDRLHVWDITSGEPLYCLDKMSSQQLPALSPGRHLLAIPDGTGVTLVNSRDGQSLGHVPVAGLLTPCAAFHPDGRRVALCADNQLLVFNIESGQPELDVTLAEQIAGMPIGWVSENLLVSQGGSLIDTELGLVVWNYTVGGSKGVGVRGAVLVFSGTQNGVLASLPVPHPAARQSMVKLRKAGDKLFLVQPGSTVALDAQVMPGVERDEVITALRTAVERAGWKVAERAPVVVLAKIGRGQPQQLSFTSGRGSQVNPDPKDVTQATLTPFTADLEIKKGKNVLWTRRTENRVPPILFLAEGETVQQAVSKFERPEASFFETLNIPPRIALAEISQSIGLSALEGVQWKDLPLDIVNRNRRR